MDGLTANRDADRLERGIEDCSCGSLGGKLGPDKGSCFEECDSNLERLVDNDYCKAKDDSLLDSPHGFWHQKMAA